MFLFGIAFRMLAASIVCIVVLSACASSATNADVDETAMLHQIIGELIVETDSATSHVHGPNAFGSGPVSSRYKWHYQTSVVHMSEIHRVEFFWSGMRHLGFQGGTMDLFLDLVRNDSAIGAFKERLYRYITTAEEIDRITPGVENARKVLKALSIDRV